MPDSRPHKETLPAFICDVDGVILPHRSHAREVGGYETLRVRGWGEFVIHPDVTALLKEAEVRAEIIWCTRWQMAASEMLAPAMGLASHNTLALDLESDNPKWKAVKEFDADSARPLIWVDDNEIPPFAEEWASRREGPTLIIRPQSSLGISDKERAQIREFLCLHGSDRKRPLPAKYKVRKGRAKPRFS